MYIRPTFQNLISECGSMVARLPRDWHRWPNGDQLESWKVNWKLKVVIFVQLLNLEACGLPMLTEKPLQYFEQTRGITWYPWYVCVCILTVCLIVSNLSVSRRKEKISKNVGLSFWGKQCDQKTTNLKKFGNLYFILIWYFSHL